MIHGGLVTRPAEELKKYALDVPEGFRNSDLSPFF